MPLAAMMCHVGAYCSDARDNAGESLGAICDLEAKYGIHKEVTGSLYFCANSWCL